MSEPSNRSMQKDVKPSWLDPPGEKLQALQEVKQAHFESPVLALTIANRRLFLDTVSLVYQISVNVLRQQDGDHPKNLVTIGYWSRYLTDLEPRYSAFEWECLAVALSILTLHP